MVSSELWFGSTPSFYNGVVTQSARFDDGSSAYMSRTPSGTGNQKTWTWSGWVKKTQASTSDIAMFSANGGGDTWFLIGFSGSNTGIDVDWYNGSTRLARKFSNAVFRDSASWYHVVVAVDTTDTTADDRIKVYINSEQITSWSVSTNPSQDSDTYVNSANLHTIGKNASTSRTTYFDGYLAEVNLVDGSQLTPTSFGETKNGVWIPKAYSGSYGTNGFRLEFKQTGTGTASSSTIGADTSGNNNHFTSSGIVASDCNMPDSPENNFATMDSLSFALTTDNIAEGNLRVGQTDQFVHASAFAFPKSGKWYWEVYSKSSNGSNYYMPYAGVCNSTFFHSEQDVSSSAGDTLHNTAGFSHIRGNDAKYKNLTGTSTQNGTNTATEGQAGTEQGIVGFALDVDAGTLKFYWNNSLVRTDSTLTAEDEFFAFTVGTNSGGNLWNYNYFNFGQDSTFAGNLSAGGNADANGVGDFAYAPPSGGYLALCSANISDDTLPISPAQTTQADDHFNTVLYTGNQSDNHSITGVSFQPDWIWGKHRDGTNSHQLLDSTRGVTHNLKADVYDPEGTSTTILASFDAPSSIGATDGGFTLNASGGLNKNTDGFVAWLWLANGTTPTKTYKVKVVADSTDYGHGTGSNKYQFFKSDGTTGYGTNGVDLDLQEGGTYTFDWSDSTAQSHPIRFSLTNDGTHSSGTSAGSEYTTGVVKDDSAYTTTITVASGVANLYYYCQNHSGMGAEIRTNTTHGSTNFDGSILSVSNANTLAGFSIVTYEIDSSGAKTIGHGLTQAPQLIINKGRDQNSSWWTFTTVIDGTLDYVRLNDVTAKADDSLLSLPTSTTFGMIENYTLQQNAVAYCFHSVEGYSKIGTYTSNNSSTDNTFVFTGFRPAFLIFKMTPSSTEWVMMDNKKSSSGGGNPIDKGQYPNYDYAEYSGNKVDFLSNGFKVRDTSGVGYSTRVVLYIAFAEQPFKYANAR